MEHEYMIALSISNKAMKTNKQNNIIVTWELWMSLCWIKVMYKCQFSEMKTTNKNLNDEEDEHQPKNILRCAFILDAQLHCIKLLNQNQKHHTVQQPTIP